MSRIVYFDCFSGISGDMTLGALLDAGLDFKALKSGLGRLKLGGYELKVSKVRRGELAGTKFDCVIKKSAHGLGGHSRPLKEIFAIINKSSLKPQVRANAVKIFEGIGRAEAKVHGARPAHGVHLHELGDIDSIIDIVGAAIALDELGIDEVYASAITMGRTAVDVRHGRLPVPAPAALELLKSRNAPLKVSEVEAELVTPTGAGILAALAKGFGPMPQASVGRVGYGAGSREFGGLPNMLRVLIGEAAPAHTPGVCNTAGALLHDSVTVIETNIDDMSPQSFEYLFERLLKEGALDVYTTNILMKKTRPAFKLTVIANNSTLKRLAAIIFEETTSIGLRYYEASRLKLDRKTGLVKTRYGAIKVKTSAGPGGILTSSPEHDDCVRIARAKNMPLKKVYDEAKRGLLNAKSS